MRRYGKKFMAVLLIAVMAAQMGILQLSAASNQSPGINGEISVKAEKNQLTLGEEVDLWDQVMVQDSSGKNLNEFSQIAEIKPDTFEKVVREEGQEPAEVYIFKEAGTYEITYKAIVENQEKSGIRTVEVTEPEEIGQEDSQAAQNLLNEEAGPEAGDNQEAGNGTKAGDNQEAGNGPESGDAQVAGNDSETGGNQETGEAGKAGNDSETGETGEAENGPETGDNQETGDGQGTQENLGNGNDQGDSGSQEQGGSQEASDKQNGDDTQENGDSQNPGNAQDSQENGDSDSSQNVDKTQEQQNEQETDVLLPNSAEGLNVLNSIGTGINSLSSRAGGTFRVHVDSQSAVGTSPESTGIMDFFRIHTSDPNWNNWWYMGYALRWIESTSRYAYCFEAGQSSSSSDIYGANGAKWADSALYSALAYTMAHGAQYVQQDSVDSKYSIGAGDGTWPLDYAITQLVAHALIADPELNPASDSDQHGWSNEIKFSMSDVQVADDARYYVMNSASIDFNAYKNQALSIAKQFFNDAKAYGKWANNGYLDKIEFNVDTTSQPTLNGSNYEATFTVTPKSTSRDGSSLDHSSEFDKSSLKLTLSNAPSGAKIVAVDASKGQYKITFPKSSVEAGKTYNITVKASGKFDREKVMNYRSNNTNNQSMGFWEVTEEDVEDSTTFQLSVPSKLRLNVKKDWTGEWSQTYRPETVKVQLWRKSSAKPGGELVPYSYKTLKASENWTLPDDDDWKNLPIADSNGNVYTYYVKETVPSGYTFVSSTETTSSGTIVITNKQKQISLTVEKKWTGSYASEDLPDSITVELWRKSDANPNGSKVKGSDKTLKKSQGWKLPSNDIWEHLPVADKDGNVYTYYVKETVPSGFTFVSTTYAEADEVYENSQHQETITITNTAEEGPGFKLLKVDEDNPDMGLQGAEFILTDSLMAGKELMKAVSDADGVVSFENLHKVMTPNKEYFIYESKAPEGYKLDGGYIGVTLSSGAVNVTTNGVGSAGTTHTSGEIKFTMKNEKSEPVEAEFTVKKVDSQNESVALEGAEFALRNSRNGANLQTAISGADGLVKFDKLDVGTYYVVETKAPEGYLLPEGYIQFKVSAQGSISIVDNGYGDLGNKVTNQPYDYQLGNEEQPRGSFVLKKADESGNGLKDAKFSLYKDSLSGTVVDTEKSASSTGKVTFRDLLPGTYYIKETTAPSEYKLPEGYIKFVINQEGEVSPWDTENGYGDLGQVQESGDFHFILKNEKIETSVKLKKVDSETENPLAGAVFELRSDTHSGTTLDTKTSDSDGMVTFEHLKAGETYYIVETKMPEGYKDFTSSINYNLCVRVKATGEVTMTPSYSLSSYIIKEDTAYVIWKNEPKKVDIYMYKVDAEDGGKLNGAVFELRQTPEGTPLQTIEIGKNSTEGYASFRDLGNGTYYIVETKAPDGYNALGEGHIKVTVSKGQIADVEVRYQEEDAAMITVEKRFSGASVSITVKNNKKEEIQLPETGGRGNLPFTCGGLMLLGIGLLLAIKYQKQRREVYRH